MAELATIARPYAEALFKATAADLDGTVAWLDELAVIARNEQLLQFADDPKVTDAQVFDLIQSIARTPLPPVGQNFLRTIIENGRLAALPEIAAQYHALRNARRGVAEAIVQSAFPLEPAALQDVLSVLERRFGCKLEARVEVDPSLIGGVRVRVGDEVLDTSVKARLEQMKVALTA